MPTIPYKYICFYAYVFHIPVSFNFSITRSDAFWLTYLYLHHLLISCCGIRRRLWTSSSKCILPTLYLLSLAAVRTHCLQACAWKTTLFHRYSLFVYMLSHSPKVHKLRTVIINICTVKSSFGEIVKKVEQWNVDVCCMQEVQWQRLLTRLFVGKEHKYKLFWIGSSDGMGVLLVEKWVDKVIKVYCRIITLRRALYNVTTVTFVSGYSPHAEQDSFYKSLLQTTTAIRCVCKFQLWH